MPKKLLGPGRRPTGPGGTFASQFPRLSLRLPPKTLRKLERWSLATHEPIWKILTRLIERATSRLRGPVGAQVRGPKRRK